MLLQRIITAFCLFLLFTVVGSTQHLFQYRQQITTDNGLPGNQVDVITQDADGFMWLGTRSGLARYDGSSFQIYKHDQEDSTSLIDDYIRDIEPIGNKLWVGTAEGISVLDLHTDKFTNYYLNSDGTRAPRRGENTVGASLIYHDRLGRTWIGGREDVDYGWGLYDSETDSFHCYSIDPATLSGDILSRSRVNNVLTIQADNSNDSIVWVGTSTGLIKFNAFTHTTQHFYYPVESKLKELHYNAFRRLWQAPDGRLYCGSWSGGLNIFDPATGDYYPAPYSNENMEGVFFQSIREILPKSETEIWITLFKSLIAYDFVEERITLRLESDFATQEIYGADFIDRDGRIWSRLYGMHIFDPKLQQFQFASFEDLNVDGEGFTFDVVEDTARNRYTVISRDCDALYHYYPETNTWDKTALTPEIFSVNRFEGNNGLMISDDEMIISAYHEIFRYYPGKEKMELLDVDLPVKLNAFYELVPDLVGNLWFGTADDGVFYWNPETGDTRQVLQEIGGNSITRGARIRHIDSYNNVWITRQERLYVYDNPREYALSLCNMNPLFCGVNEIDEDLQRRIWIRKNNNQIIVAKLNGPGCSVDTVLSAGTRQAPLRSIVIDEQGYVWGFMRSEIVRISPHDYSMLSYNTEYLEDFNEITNVSIVDGHTMVLGMANGLLFIDLNELRPNTEQPRPYISGIDVREKPLESDIIPSKLESLELNHNENFFSISFSSLGYTMAEENRFQYRLADLESDWIDAKGRRFANYTNVPSGQYVFELQVFNSEGDLSPFNVQLPITVKRHWTELAGVQLAGILIFLGLIYAIYRFRVNTIKKEEELKAQFQTQLANVEMTALRSQMNPHFIFNCLNSIESFIIKNDTLRASTYLNDFARLIRLILQNSRSQFVPLQDEIEALELYLQMESLRFTNRFNYEVTVSEDIDQGAIDIPPMLIQPYVENAIWHGLIPKDEVGQLSIELSRENGMLHCVIEDNGIGRDRSGEINRSRGRAKSKSMGMTITKDRIDLLNQQHQTNTNVRIVDRYHPDGSAAGTRVELNIAV